jgi:hypothetical protein
VRCGSVLCSLLAIGTSCAISDRRSQGPRSAVLGTGRRWADPGLVQGWSGGGASGPAGCGPTGGPTWNLALGPWLAPGLLAAGCWVLGSVAGDPGRHRGWGWLLCPSSVPAPGGRGLRPRVFSAHRPAPLPQLQVQHAPAWGVTIHCTNFYCFETPKPQTAPPARGAPHLRCLYQPPAAMGGRAGGAPLTPRRAPGAPGYREGALQ